MFKLLNTRDITDAGLECRSNVNGDIRLESEVELGVFCNVQLQFTRQPAVAVTPSMLFLRRVASFALSSSVGLWAERLCLQGRSLSSPVGFWLICGSDESGI